MEYVTCGAAFRGFAGVYTVSSFLFQSLEKKKKLFTSLGSVCIVKNCDLELENALFKTLVTVFHYTDLPARK